MGEFISGRPVPTVTPRESSGQTASPSTGTKGVRLEKSRCSTSLRMGNRTHPTGHSQQNRPERRDRA
jgi:hypothetical protein